MKGDSAQRDGAGATLGTSVSLSGGHKGDASPDAATKSRDGRVQTLLAILVVQAVMLGIGWVWAFDETRRAVALSVREKIVERQVSQAGAAGTPIVPEPESSLVSLTDEPMRGVLYLSIATGLVVLLVTMFASLRLMRRHDERVDAINKGLEAEVRARVAKATATRDALIRGLAKLADYRDSDTGTHLDRIAAYSRLLAESVRDRYPQIDDAWIERLGVASSLHDIGKVGIPDEVLLKPGRYTAEEMMTMQAHPLIGADTLIAVRELMGNDELVEMSVRVTLYHHERWDSTGYPMRVGGTEIPLEARIVALADVYDALTSRRVYKEAVPHARVVEIIKAAREKHFDPTIVDGFLAVEAKFNEVRERMQPRAQPHVWDVKNVRESRNATGGGGECGGGCSEAVSSG